MPDLFDEPEAGRHVHYFNDIWADPLAAVVTDTLGWIRGVNEKVFVTIYLARGGFQYRELTLCQPYDLVPKTDFLTWMPHTIEQMKKKAADEKATQDNYQSDIDAALNHAMRMWRKNSDLRALPLPVLPPPVIPVPPFYDSGSQGAD